MAKDRQTLDVGLLSGEEKLLARLIQTIIRKRNNARHLAALPGFLAVFIFLWTPPATIVAEATFSATQNLLLALFAIVAGAYLLYRTARSITLVALEYRMMPELRRRMDELVHHDHFDALTAQTSLLLAAQQELDEECLLASVVHDVFVQEALARRTNHRDNGEEENAGFDSDAQAR